MEEMEGDILSILISDKIHFKPKKITSHYGQYINVSIHQEDLTVVNIYSPFHKNMKMYKIIISGLKGRN